MSKMRVGTAVLVSMLVLCSVVLSGCSALKPLWPGGVTAADAEWAGSKSMQAVPVSSLVSPELGAITLLGSQDPFGVLLPLIPIGETTPRWVFCNAKLSSKCAAIPLNARVKVAGSSVTFPSPFRMALEGLFPLLAETMSKELWIAKDVSASDFNDGIEFKRNP